MRRKWQDFDVADLGAWADHSRPWDYDHILPAATLYYRQQSYKQAADEWINTIGNYRAWPLELNRSRSDELLESIDEHEKADSLLTLDYCDARDFCLQPTDFDDAERAAAFMNAARRRMLRMYRNWYESLEIGYLLG